MVRRCVNGPVRAAAAAAVTVEVAGWSWRCGELLVVTVVDIAAATWGMDV
jgi:hypothetical protein